MIIVPNTNIRLIKVPLSIDSKNQLTFNNKQEQFDYFFNLEHLNIENATYQRKDGVIRYPALIDDIIQFNYVMYQNTEYTDKWFYAYIVNMRYINDNMTEILILTDVWQTWQFDLEFKQSFVEREMCLVSEDVPGFNLLAEGLETGEFIKNASSSVNGLGVVYVIAYSRNPETDELRC